MHFTTVGLTGGIASGKSSVAELWRAHGAAIVDSDELAHRALDPGTATYEAVVSEFGTEILNETGVIQRPKLGAIVFADPLRREALNRIVHPAIRRAWKEEVARLKTSGNCSVAVVAIPLLFETNAETEFDVIVVVGCSEETQRARLAAKGLSSTQAQARIQSQMPTQAKMDRGNFVVWNDGSRSIMERQSDLIWSKIKEN